ncbi:MAG: hypothetical protein WKG06_28885 [Segetibacter sp.]
MATKYLIDKSAAIKYLNQTLPINGIAFVETFINTDCTIFFISEIELQVWKPDNPEDIFVYQQFVSQSDIIGINRGMYKVIDFCGRGTIYFFPGCICWL